ncbi:9611_t:CDS:2 [Paraglomus occultum]|uniref:9611_t:CDS:1 n=1 Tax=Paraglomus occultum TaxID=144539 RepID=A0A9N9GGY6_9GLOM|nr:9611_t:CDS:2 [Paraglomus occultum]
MKQENTKSTATPQSSTKKDGILSAKQGKDSGNTGSSTSTTTKNVPSSTPAINIFSNDGSFLERFKRMKAEEDEKKKQLEALDRKKAFEDRIKNRGKRKLSATESPGLDVSTDGVSEAKRPHLEKSTATETLDPNANAYLKEMQKYNERLCKDDSGHVRPLVK